MTQKLKQATKTTAKIGFAAALIYWMVQKGALDFNAFGRLATPLLVSAFAGLIFLQIFINNYRWLVLLRGQGFPSTVQHTMPLSLIGMFFNFVMPGGVGGDVIKGYYLLQDHPQQKFAGAISIFMDRMMGFFIMIATAFMALFFNWQKVSHSRELQGIALGVAGLFTCFLIFYFVSLSRVLQKGPLHQFVFHKMPGGHQFHRLYEILHSYRKHPRALVSAGILSVLNQGVTVAFVYLVAQAMGITEIPLSVYFFIVPVGVTVQALPISPAGIGVGQAAFYFLFNLYLGKQSQLGPTAVTAMQLMSFAWGVVGAFFYLKRKKPAHEASLLQEESCKGA